MRKCFANILGLLIVFLFFSAGASDLNPVLKIADGVPLVAEVIGQDSFVPVTVEKLKNAKVWFVDYEWHRKHGVEIPPNGIDDPKFAQQILDAYAWQSRGIEDHDGQYTGDKKNWYADYYGGYGMGYNYGSGRAAAMGLVQAKGTRTSMVVGKSPWHSNGAVQTIEAVDEAIWSQVLNSEMKYGSNKVVAVILTGTYATMPDNGQIFPRALIIREMAVRPAHFQLNYSRDRFQDRTRVSGIMKNLVSSLPFPEGYQRKSDSTDLKVGIFELADREAKTQAEYYARRMFFGSASPSNLEITGRRLDLGDHTFQEGYTQIYRVDHAKAWGFGTTGGQEYIFADMLKSWSQTLPDNLKANLPTLAEVQTRYRKTFEEQKRVELAKLSGAPENLVERLQNDEDVRSFGALLSRMTAEGNTEIVFTNPDGWENTSKYNINQLLADLAQAGSDRREIRKALNKNIKQGLTEQFLGTYKFKKQFLTSYLKFKEKIRSAAAVDGVSSSALDQYMKITASRKNKTVSNLIRGHRRWGELWETTDLGIDGDPKIVEKYIEDQTSQAITSFRDLNPYYAVLRQESNRPEGITLNEVFDARTGHNSTVIRVSTVGGKTFVNGASFTADELAKAAVEIQGHLAQASVVDDAVEFKVDGLTGAKLSEVDLRKGNVVPFKSSDKSSLSECRAIFAK